MQLYKSVVYVINTVASFLFLYMWIAGTVLASGWMKILAFFFFPYARYLFVEKFLMLS